MALCTWGPQILDFCKTRCLWPRRVLKYEEGLAKRVSNLWTVFQSAFPRKWAHLRRLAAQYSFFFNNSIASYFFALFIKGKIEYIVPLAYILYCETILHTTVLVFCTSLLIQVFQSSPVYSHQVHFFFPPVASATGHLKKKRVLDCTNDVNKMDHKVHALKRQKGEYLQEYFHHSLSLAKQTVAVWSGM